MRKSNLKTGIVYILIGIGILLAAFFADDRLQGLMYGFAGGILGPGIAAVIRYFYWNRPQKREEYALRLEREQIHQKDERNIMLRDRAARYVFLLDIYVVSISMVVFAILGNLGMMEGSKIIVLYLAGLLAVNLIASVVIYNRLLKT